MLQINRARHFMNVYVISPAAPLFLAPLATCPSRAVVIPADFSARNALRVMTRRYKEVGGVQSVSAMSHPYTDERAWDNFAEHVFYKTQVFDSVERIH